MVNFLAQDRTDGLTALFVLGADRTDETNRKAYQMIVIPGIGYVRLTKMASAFSSLSDGASTEELVDVLTFGTGYVHVVFTSSEKTTTAQLTSI